MQSNQAPGAPAADDLVTDTTTQAFMKDVIEESKKRAGAGRLLGALVRPVQDADARFSRRR